MILVFCLILSGAVPEDGRLVRTWPLRCRLWKGWHLLWNWFWRSMVTCLFFFCLAITQEFGSCTNKTWSYYINSQGHCRRNCDCQRSWWTYFWSVSLILQKLIHTHTMEQWTKLLNLFLFVCCVMVTDLVKSWTSHRRELRLQTLHSRSCSWRRCGLQMCEVYLFFAHGHTSWTQFKNHIWFSSVTN